MRKKQYIVFSAVCALLLVSGCSFGSETVQALPEAVVSPEPTATPVVYESGAGKVLLTEVMSKNRATVQDADGSFPDWIELRNVTDTDLSLCGWRLSDGRNEWTFPEFTLYARSAAVVYMSKKDRADQELHASFSLSEGDTVLLLDRNGDPVDECFIDNDESDRSLVREEDGAWVPCAYPTPGYANTAEGYEQFCNARSVASPLVINEVCVENFSDYETKGIGYPDWIELRNISQESVDLSGYYISDDSKLLKQYNLQGVLPAGATVTVLCDKDAAAYTGERMMAPFSLNSANDRVYLSSADGRILDYTALKCIPYGKTFGRVEGKAGYFYLLEKTPGKPNSDGARRISEKPQITGRDGIFNGVDSVTVELHARGDIYYTLDCSEPTAESVRYSGPVTLYRTGVVRAVSMEEGALPSEVLTLNFIINENHSLPVASLVCGDARFRTVYANGIKEDRELPASLSFYEDGASFTAGCGVKLNGASSLVLPKKNLSVRFRGSYGTETLNYDLFGGGVTSFQNLVLRAGQDQNNTIVRNEACYALASEFSGHVLTPRFRYCVLYLNGVYNGIYTVMEKPNEAFAASALGVSKDSIEMLESSVYGNDSLYKDVIGFVYENDMALEENYAKLCSVLDVDSLIDWTLLQGYLANYDLASGNLRYVRSGEGDGKWRLVFYDLDCAFSSPGFIMYNVLTFDNQPSTVNRMLVKNPVYRDRLLRRAAEGFSTVLNQEHMTGLIDTLCREVESEVERDGTFSYMTPETWKRHVAELEAGFDTYGWDETALDSLCEILSVTPEERAMYFGG